jgi:tetratricopeptide (TPR) repeat protein
VSLADRLRLHRSPLLLVVGLALLVRIVVLIDAMDAPTFSVPVVDARTYDQAARTLADGLGLDYRFFWQPFFYPVFLGFVYLLSGGSILAAKLVQLLLGVMTCGLTLRVGTRVAGPAAGLIAGLVCALHGPMIFFETELLATGWACFWSILLLERLTRESSGSRSWFATGLFAGCAALTRPTFLPAVILATVVVLWGKESTGRLRNSISIASGFAAVTLPVALLGALTVGYFSFLPASGPMNLFLGNNHEPCETLTIRPGDAWTELTRQAQPEGAGDLEANRVYFTERLLDEIGQYPGALALGVAGKGVRIVSGRALPRNVDPYFVREYSPWLSALMFRAGGFGFPTGVLLPFAVWGAWAARRRIPPAMMVYVGAYLLAVVAVFVSARYRMPMIPPLAILAGAGCVAIAEAARARRFAVLATAAGVIAIVAVLSSVPGPFCEEEVDYAAETLYAVGYARHSASDLEGAAEAYSQALRRRPDYPELLNQFALLRSHQERWSEAIAYWSRAARVDPDNLAVRMNLGRAASIEQRHELAFENYEAAIRIDPDNADARLGSGFALLGLARFEEGVGRLEQAVDLDRGLAERLPPVIEALATRGHPDLAERLRSKLVR